MSDHPTSFSRRGALKTLAVTATGIMVVPPLATACTSAAASASGTVGTGGLISSDICQIMPEVTEGPYYLDRNLVRRDIREGRAGAPMLLRLQVVDGACRPLPGARVDVWHCDAQGNYSAFGGMSGEQANTDETYLRGTQMADARGIVEFDTIYPGWYRGRTTHIHYKVFLDETNVLTGQIFVPDALSEYLYEHGVPYQRDDQRDTVNGTDDIAQEATRAAFAHIKEEAEFYLVQLVIGVDPSAVSQAGQMPGGPGARPGDDGRGRRPPPEGGRVGERPAGPPPTGPNAMPPGGMGPSGNRDGASLIPGIEENQAPASR